jgi:hypothetical protein|tara:strand:- start:4886 stop:5071 length:186 start_codon:yes stop_codon:yes gene_type:complete
MSDIFLTYKVTLEEFKLDIIKKLIAEEQKDMSMEEEIVFEVLLQIVDQWENELGDWRGSRI